MPNGQTRKSKGSRSITACTHPREIIGVCFDGFHFWFIKGAGYGIGACEIDRFTKYAVFILASATCTTKKTVELFLRHMVKLFGVSADIISDRDA